MASVPKTGWIFGGFFCFVLINCKWKAMKMHRIFYVYHNIIDSFVALYKETSRTHWILPYIKSACVDNFWQIFHEPNEILPFVYIRIKFAPILALKLVFKTDNFTPQFNAQTIFHAFKPSRHHYFNAKKWNKEKLSGSVTWSVLWIS